MAAPSKPSKKRAARKEGVEATLTAALFGAQAWAAVRAVFSSTPPPPALTWPQPPAPAEESTAAPEAGIEPEAKRRRVAAWTDEDDALEVSLVASERRLKLRAEPGETHTDAAEFQRRLATQRAKLTGADTAWAEAEVDEVAPQVNVVARAEGGPLAATQLLVGRLPDANRAEYAHSTVQALAFHDSGEILLVAGQDRTLRLFACDERDEEQAKLQSVFLEDLPVRHALWAQRGAEIVLGGDAPFFYAYDVQGNVVEKVRPLSAPDAPALVRYALSPEQGVLACGTERGRLLLLDARTKALTGELDVAATLTGLAFSAPQRLVASARDGAVLEFDLRQGRCLERWQDAGAHHTSALAVAPGLLATGQEAGVVNLYAEGAHVPRKSVMNLTTPIDCLAFNPDAQLLAFASRHKRNALRLLHTATGTVYANFPKSTSPLSRVSAVAFSPDSARLALGNVHGKVLLYKLHHYAPGSRR